MYPSISTVMQIINVITFSTGQFNVWFDSVLPRPDVSHRLIARPGNLQAELNFKYKEDFDSLFQYLRFEIVTCHNKLALYRGSLTRNEQ